MSCTIEHFSLASGSRNDVNNKNADALLDWEKERNKETGLYYFGARYLDARTSRWLSTDPALREYIPKWN
ncbi:MAG: hypothetical protein Ta2B_30090 [Termitinemataceae bacterium]|nr:MAG: hypothetical protein Ta2B_30090 [Termitinemataceae bacterium]